MEAFVGSLDTDRIDLSPLVALTDLARLEAARLNAAEAVSPQAAPPPIPTKPAPSSGPPPLKKRKPPPAPAPNQRPAHLLVAQLEQEERRRAAQEQARLQELFEAEPKSEIAAASLDLPQTPKKKKRIPDAVLFGLLAVIVVGGLVAVFMNVRKEPPPKVEVAPALVRAAEQRKKAFAALERGHALAQQGKGKAKEALDAYHEALKYEPKLASAERGLGVVYAVQGDAEKAVKHYRRYLEMEPKAKDAEKVRAIVSAYEKASKKKKR